MKYTLQEARKILGVIKTSSKDDLEKKYDVILKKYRIMKLDGTLDENEEAEFQKCTDAYRILMGYEVDEPKIEKKETYTDLALGKVGIDRKKADNFFHYYKYHLIIGIVAIIIIAISVHSFVTRVQPDITLGLLGEINYDAEDRLKAEITKNIPELKEIQFDSAILSSSYNDAQSYANLQKAVALIVASDIDLYLVNKYAFDTYAKNGAFKALDDIAKDLNVDISKSEDLKLRVVDEWSETSEPGKLVPKTYVDSKPRLYGINVTDSEFFKDINIVGPEKILVVRVEPKNYDLVLKLIKLFTK